MKLANRCAGALACCWGVSMLLAAAKAGEQSTSNAPSPTPAAKRALILSGDGTHDWRKTTAFLSQLLTDSGHFEVRVCEVSAGLTAETLAPFEVVVDDSFGAGLNDETERALEQWVSSGRGLVVTRGGLATLGGAAAGTPAARRWSGLLQATVASKPGTSSDVPLRLFEIKQVLPKHPVMAGLKAGL